MRTLIRLNGAAFFLVAIVSVIPMETTAAGRIVRSLVELSAIFILPGINLAMLLQLLIRKNFSLLETLSLSAAFSIFVLPFVLAVEFTFFKKVFSLLPLVNALSLFAALATAAFFVSHKQHREGTAFPKFPLFLLSNWRFFRSKEFISPLLLYIFVSLSIVAAFYPLPDLDPYYWYEEFQRLFSDKTLVDITGHRPLFAALVYILTIGAHIDFYACFKYALPFLSLSLLLPFSLLASQFRKPLHQVIFLLFPFINGINIIYLALPIPQALASITTFFAAAFMTYAWMQKSDFFFFVGGAVLSFGYWYHEILIVPIAIFAITTGLYFHRELYAFVRSHILSTVLFIILILPYLSNPTRFIVSKIQTQLPLLAEFRTNLFFPQHYINIDGNEMGWGDFVGVSKYYSFYAGPVLCIILCALLFKRKQIFRGNILFSKYSAPLTISCFFFLALAEILPRFFSIALLPDRAWIFVGAFALVFIPPILKTSLGRKNFFLWILIIGFSLNIGAAVYINTLKKYMITEYQLVSAQWIKENLPENRIIFSSDHKRLLQFYSDSEVIPITNPNLLFSISLFENELKKYDRNKEYALHAYEKEMNQVKNTLKEIETKNLEKEISNIEPLIEKIESSLSNSQSLLKEASDMIQAKTSKSFYVYYAAPDPRNPYLDRPYMKKIIGRERDLIFNKNPERFKRVYADEKHNIYLWKIL